MLTEDRFTPQCPNAHDMKAFSEWDRTRTPEQMNQAGEMYQRLTADLMRNPETDNDYVTRVVCRRIGIACGFYPPFWPLNPERQ